MIRLVDGVLPVLEKALSQQRSGDNSLVSYKTRHLSADWAQLRLLDYAQLGWGCATSTSDIEIFANELRFDTKLGQFLVRKHANIGTRVEYHWAIAPVQFCHHN